MSDPVSGTQVSNTQTVKLKKRKKKTKHLCVLQQHNSHTAPLTQSSHFQSVLSSRALIAGVRGLQTRHFVTPAVSAARSGSADGVTLPTCHYTVSQEAQSQCKQQRTTRQQGMTSRTRGPFADLPNYEKRSTGVNMTSRGCDAKV